MKELSISKKHIFWCMVIIVAIFLFSVCLGYWMAITYVEESKLIIRRLFSQFEYVKKMSNLFIFLTILFNNAIKGFLIMLFGVFFGLSAVIFIFINGQLIGLVLGVSNAGIGPVKIIIGLLPHGILEIPAIILSASYGLWLGYRFYRFSRFGEPFKFYFFWALKKYVRIILPLLIIAALIETFVTPYVLQKLM